MAKKKKSKTPQNPAEENNFRLNPEARVTPSFDSESIAKYPVAKPDEMGFRVVDDFVREHIL